MHLNIYLSFKKRQFGDIKQINNDTSVSDCHLETDALMAVLSMPYGVGIEYCKDVGLEKTLSHKMT